MSTPKTRPRSTEQHPSRKTSVWRWVGFIVVPLSLAALVALSAVEGTTETAPDQAIPFELATTYGGTVSLEDTLSRGDALLYFSMGVGCDGCFAQIPAIEAEVARRGMSLLPIMVNPTLNVEYEAARWGIVTPILIDPDAQVSTAYGMIGVYGHGDRPSHSFALVRQDGSIGWVRHYAEMFVPSDALFAEMDAALGT